MIRVGCVAWAFAVLSVFAVAADPAAIVTDSAGIEVKLATAKLGAGTRRLAWLADPKATTDDGKRGPLAVEFRETNSTLFTNGVVTLVPVSSLMGLKTDEMAKTVSLKVAGFAEPLVGPGQYKGINQLGLDGTADGKAVKYVGGNPKMNFRAVTFPDAKAWERPASTGPVWQVTIDQPKANNPTLAVTNPKLLITLPGGAEKLVDVLPIRKGEPVKLDQVTRLELLVTGNAGKPVAVEVTLADGTDRVLIVPTSTDIASAKGTIVGLIGEVSVGWKLFPLHTIIEVKAVVGK